MSVELVKALLTIVRYCASCEDYKSCPLKSLAVKAFSHFSRKTGCPRTTPNFHKSNLSENLC